MKIGYVPIFVALAGCAVGDPQYPLSWGPLPHPPASDCVHFEGVYADEGDTRDRFQKASFTRELFGYRPGWKAAKRVEFSFLDEDALLVTVWSEEGELIKRTLSAEAGDFTCDAGRLVIRNERWVVEELLAAHENTTLELHANGRYLVARVNERSYAMAFVVVPFAADATHWFRFPRLPAKGHP